MKKIKITLITCTILCMGYIQSTAQTVDEIIQKHVAAIGGTDNWKKVSRERYENALMRHAVSYMSGEKIDPESGMNHLSHIMCNALFLKWNDDKK